MTQSAPPASEQPSFPQVRPRSALANIIFNASGFFIAIAITFFLSPFLIRTLGDAQYGVYALVVEITSYYSIADLGIRGAVGYFSARYAAANDLAMFRRVSHAALSILAAAAALIVILSLAVAYSLPHWIVLDTVEPDVARRVVLIMSAMFAFNLPASVFPAILYGLRRLDVTNLAELVYRIGSAALAVVVLQAGYGLETFVATQALSALARTLVEASFVWRLGLGFRLLPSWPERTLARDLFSYGVRNTLINISQMIVSQLDLVVIASLLSARWVTPFSIARSMIHYMGALISTVTRSLTPEFTRLHTEGKTPELVDRYLRISRLVTLFAAWVATGLLVFGKCFLALWIGERYVIGGPLVSRRHCNDSSHRWHFLPVHTEHGLASASGHSAHAVPHLDQLRGSGMQSVAEPNSRQALWPRRSGPRDTNPSGWRLWLVVTHVHETGIPFDVGTIRDRVPQAEPRRGPQHWHFRAMRSWSTTLPTIGLLLLRLQVPLASSYS